MSNREADPDRVFNYDVFAVNVGERRRAPAHRHARTPSIGPIWSPDGKPIAYLGTKRALTSSETTMEDTHVWLMDATAATGASWRRSTIARAQPRWSPDGSSVYFTVQERGSARLYRMPVAGGQPTVVAPVPNERGSVGSWSIAKGAQGDVLAYALEYADDAVGAVREAAATAPREGADAR